MMLCLFYLCLGELLPLPVAELLHVTFGDSTVQQALLVSIICCLAVLLATCGGVGGCGGCGGLTSVFLLAMLNLAPPLAAGVATNWSLMSQNCPSHGAGCGQVGVLLDVVGLVAARLARLNLGACLLFAANGESTWLLGATGIGYAKAMPLHQAAGWWCAGQSALHSVAYILFYLYTGGGLRSLWLNIFTESESFTTWNRTGLINGFGVLALMASLALVLPALPWLRRRCYELFQLLHLPLAALFVVLCALHDLPILLFAAPGLAGWYLGRRGPDNISGCGYSRKLPAKARLLPGTSGPWVELVVSCDVPPSRASSAPCGQWVSVRVLSLGREAHPLSVTTSATGNAGELTVVVSARSGDWSLALAALAQPSQPEVPRKLEVEVAGPFPFGCGGGGWSLTGAERRDEPALFLLAGGTGVTGWLPALSCSQQRQQQRQQSCHLVWCVRSEADYLALADRLPPSGVGVSVTVFVTQPAAEASGEPVRIAAVEGALVVDAAGPTSLPEGGGDGDGSKRSSMALVSLAAALVGVLASYWGYEYRNPGDMTMGVYVMVRRCLPVVLVFASMAVTTAIGTRVFASYARLSCLLNAHSEEGPILPADLVDSSEIPMAAGNDAEAPRQVRAGRPDISALVSAAAEELRGTQSRLVVVTCGPARLVRAARLAVQTAQKECGRGIGGVHVEFSASESSW